MKTLTLLLKLVFVWGTVIIVALYTIRELLKIADFIGLLTIIAGTLLAMRWIYRNLFK